MEGIVKALAPVPFTPPLVEMSVESVPTKPVPKPVPKLIKKITLKLKPEPVQEYFGQLDMDAFVKMFTTPADFELQCKLCSSVYGCRPSLQNHYKSTHKIPSHILTTIKKDLDRVEHTKEQCPFCKWSFANVTLHISKYHKLKEAPDIGSVIEAAKTLSCATCDECYEVAVQLRDHLKTIHKVEDLQRDQIFLVSNGIPDNISVTDSDSEDDSPGCGFCGFNAKSRMDQHMTKYHGLPRLTPDSFLKRFKTKKDFDSVCKFCPKSKAFISHDGLLRHFKDIHHIPVKMINQIKKKLKLEHAAKEQCSLCTRKDATFYDLGHHFSEFHLLKSETSFSDLFNPDLECKSCFVLFVSPEDYYDHLAKDHFIDKQIIKTGQKAREKNPQPKTKIVSQVAKEGLCHRFLIRNPDELAKLVKEPVLVKTDAVAVEPIEEVHEETSRIDEFIDFNYDPTVDEFPLNLQIPSNLETNFVQPPTIEQETEQEVTADLKVAINPIFSSELLKFKDFIDLTAEDVDSELTVSDPESDVEMDLEPTIQREKDYFIVRTTLGLAKFTKKRIRFQ
jgi:hypothetical protein